jgi:hypothetical protein
VKTVLLTWSLRNPRWLTATGQRGAYTIENLYNGVLYRVRLDRTTPLGVFHTPIEAQTAAQLYDDSGHRSWPILSRTASR